MTLPATLRELFASNVTRPIAPVVWFHEISPDKLKAEVDEYIITGGWPEGDPRKTRVPNGIHEQYVKLLTGITAELARPGGVDLPVAWISGFYGSGKSSFAKLLGLALGRVELPGGRSLSEALLARDTSPRAPELRAAWDKLLAKIEPLAVVFDIGGLARGGEHLHSVVVRQLQARLDYCSKDAIVADFELDLERDGHYPRFLTVAEQVLGKPWSAVKDQELAEEDFSLVMSNMFPARYPDPMSWYSSRSGTRRNAESPEEAVAAIADMLKFRSPKSTVFFIIDEVSQFVLGNRDRVDRLRAFVTALGSHLKGKAWMWALGQQKLDEQADDSFLLWAKDRFPQRLRVDIEPTNIRDVVHQRLLRKHAHLVQDLRALFERHRPALALYAHDCADITAEEFVEVYPLLPGHIDLIMEITSAMRTRSPLAQGDDHAIRGLLQLLGELFRGQGLADAPVGALITFDQIYDVQHTALPSDTQHSMSRILHHCAPLGEPGKFQIKVAKAVAMLELVQELKDAYRTDARMVAQCIYDSLDRGDRVSAVADALDALHRAGLLGYSEKHGYKIQSTSGEEWDRERRDFQPGREAIAQIVQDSLKYLMGKPDNPRWQGRSFRWESRFSDGRRIDDAVIADPRDHAAVTVDFRLLFSPSERTSDDWVKASDARLHNRIVWVCGDVDALEERAVELGRSREMVRKYEPRLPNLSPDRKLLFQQEKNRVEDLERILQDLVAKTFHAGQFFFRGEPTRPADLGGSFETAIGAAATRYLPKIYPHYVAIQVAPAEVLQLLKPEISSPPSKFMTGELGILDLDAGRLVFVCNGVIPVRVLEHVTSEGGVSGVALLAHFGGPPYGYTADVVRACVAGLLRAKKLKIRSEKGTIITSPRDADAEATFEKDRDFRRATFSPADEDDIGFPVRAKICAFFEKYLAHRMDREDHLIADAVALHFRGQSQRLASVYSRLAQLPGNPQPPPALVRLHDAFADCLRDIRQTKPTVLQVKKHLDTLREGMQLLGIHDSELTPAAIEAVRRAAAVVAHHAAQLRDTDKLPADAAAAVRRVADHLAGERPWQAITTLEPDIHALAAAYVAERRRLLQWQELSADRARASLKAQPGFSTLTADQAHRVLRPIAAAVTTTGDDAVAPSLRELHDTFIVSLARAETDAQATLDEILSEGEKPVIVQCELGLRNRHLASEPELEALLADIRDRVLPHLRSGKRVRLT